MLKVLQRDKRRQESQDGKDSELGPAPGPTNDGARAGAFSHRRNSRNCEFRGAISVNCKES